MNYLKASYPLLYIRTHEEARVGRSIINALSHTKTAVSIYGWDSKRLLEKFDRAPGSAISGQWNQVKSGGDWTLTGVIDSIRLMGGGAGRNIFILKDFHPYISAPGQIRPIRNAIEELKGKGSMIIFVSPVITIPVELEKEIQILDFNMPTEDQLNGILNNVLDIYNKRQEEKKAPKQELSPDIRQASIEAAKGLTYTEAGDAYSLSIIENQKFDNEFILSVFEEKVKQVKRNGLLQYVKPDIKFDNIGGMEGLKKWIGNRAKAFSLAARTYKLPYPKGMLLCGIPGCGKTILAKATANEFGFPLFQLDVGSLFGRYVGE